MNKQGIDKVIKILGNFISDETHRRKYDKETVIELSNALITLKEIVENQLTNEWIPVTERLPETYRKVDGDSVYSVSNDVLCSAYNEDTAEYETWVDYTCDGEWQTHEYYEGEKLAWQPLPEAYREVLK